MTRIGPLTAQALGRSPYDDVVEGTGAEDPHAPHQEYDHRGRPKNPETKRLNRDMIRAHNEVMQVIGVAEPDLGPSNAEIESARRYLEYEAIVGSRLLRFSRFLQIGGVWGVNGLRARILLYRSYADVSFFDLLWGKYQPPLSSLLTAGFPSFLAGYALKTMGYYTKTKRRKGRLISFARKFVFSYVKGHVQLYVFLQKVGIISAADWFPSWRFFVPGLASSPIQAPAPPQDISAGSLLRYAGAWCVNALPVMSFFVWNNVWTRVTTRMWQGFYASLPNTVHHRKFPQQYAPQQRSPQSQASPDHVRSSHDFDTERATVAPSETIGAQEGALEGSDRQPRQPVDLSASNRTEVLRDIGAHVSGAETEVDSDGAPSRPGQTSSGVANSGDDFGSDEEDDNGISATLIRFDVEATDASDAPPGPWSAELRPSQPSDGGNGSGDDSMLGGPDTPPPAPSPTYIDTMLTRLPACLASDIFTVVAGYTFLAPVEAMTMRLVARSYAGQLGASGSALLADMYTPNLLADLSWRAVSNFMSLEFAYLVAAGEMWALVTSAAQLLHMTEEEWKEAEDDRIAQRTREIESELVERMERMAMEEEEEQRLRVMQQDGGQGEGGTTEGAAAVEAENEQGPD